MEWLSALFSLIILSLDAFIIGFIFGIKKIRIQLSSLFIVALITSFIMFIALFIGKVAGLIIPISGVAILSGIMLIGIGIYQFINNQPLYSDSFLFKLAVIINFDSFAYGLQAGMNGRGYGFAVFIGIFIFLAIIFGVIQGRTLKNSLIIQNITILPGVIFILLGLSKIIFS